MYRGGTDAGGVAGLETLLRSRLMTAAVAVPALLWVIFWAPIWVLNALILVLTYVALQEFAGMALKGVPAGTTMVTTGGMIIALTMGFTQTGVAISAGLVVCLSGVLIATLATAEDMERSVNHAAQILLGCLYGGLLLPHFIWVRAIPDIGPDLVCLVVGTAMAGDAAGYFGGSAWGKRKLLPRVSPNKTIEGSMSSLVVALMVAVLLNGLVLRVFSTPEVLLVALVINVLGQVGDLLESMLKRAYAAKDSGWIFPGHGGVLDRTDSLVLPIVFIYYYAILTVGR